MDLPTVCLFLNLELSAILPTNVVLVALQEPDTT